MRILVTGASGLVGTELVGCQTSQHELVGLTRAELDITDAAEVTRVLGEAAPTAVLHCAAYTDVDGAERDPQQALRVNAAGSRNVAEGARACGARVVYVSTDYVFDGLSNSPYRVGDPLRPLSSYGKSKLEGERFVSEICPRSHAIVRTGWLYGAGKGFADWARKRLRAGQDLPVVHDQIGCPTYARDLANALLRVAVGGHQGVFHFVNTGAASWLDVGRAVVDELGFGEDKLRSVAGTELQREAPRPSYSVLDVSRYEETTGGGVRPWRDALNEYLAAG